MQTIPSGNYAKLKPHKCIIIFGQKGIFSLVQHQGTFEDYPKFVLTGVIIKKALKGIETVYVLRKLADYYGWAFKGIQVSQLSLFFTFLLCITYLPFTARNTNLPYLTI